MRRDWHLSTDVRGRALSRRTFLLAGGAGVLAAPGIAGLVAGERATITTS